MRASCPTCRKPLVLVEGEPPPAHRPFCSPRCKSADLGSWLGEAFKIATPLSEEDLDQGLAMAGDSLERRDHDKN